MLKYTFPRTIFLSRWAKGMRSFGPRAALKHSRSIIILILILIHHQHTSATKSATCRDFCSLRSAMRQKPRAAHSGRPLPRQSWRTLEQIFGQSMIKKMQDLNPVMNKWYDIKVLNTKRKQNEDEILDNRFNRWWKKWDSSFFPMKAGTRFSISVGSPKPLGVLELTPFP